MHSPSTTSFENLINIIFMHIVSYEECENSLLIHHIENSISAGVINPQDFEPFRQFPSFKDTHNHNSYCQCGELESQHGAFMAYGCSVCKGVFTKRLFNATAYLIPTVLQINSRWKDIAISRAIDKYHKWKEYRGLK